MNFVRTVGRRLRDVELFVPRWIESYLLDDEPNIKQGKISLPLIAIIGPPRVGSTLIYQLLIASFQVFYLNNLQHALLRYPYLGYRLSSFLNLEYQGNLVSDFGYTPGIGGLSEGNFFWPYWFDMTNEQNLPKPNKEKLQHITRVMNKVYLSLNLPMVSGFNAHGFYLSELGSAFEKLVVINMRRDPISTAVSILRGRRKFKASEDEWWSVRPDYCFEFDSQDPYRQIACQIICIYEAIKIQRIANPGIPVIDVEYEDLCNSPSNILDTIHDVCTKANINLRHKVARIDLPSLNVRGPHPDEDLDVRRFATLLDKHHCAELWS